MKKFTFFNARYLTILFVFALLPFSVISQTHFTPPSNNGTGNWHFYPVHATLDGVALVAGDEIAIYDGSICVGARALTAALDGSYSLAVSNDWLSYEKSSGGSDGYTGGNNYTWKCWDASASTEYSGTMTYNTTYSPQDYTGTVYPATMTYRWSWVDLAFSTSAPTAGDLTGTITNSAGGAPIAGVTVTATGTSTYVTTTNASGVYLFDNIDVDTYTVSTSHADYQNASQAGVAVTNGGTTTQNFSLTYKTGTLTGTVSDNSSNVVSGATVQITGGSSTTTNASGVYTITGIAPSTYTVVASKTGYASSTQTGVVINPDASTTQNFTINSAGTLSGTVTDGTNGGTEDGVLVTVSGGNGSATTAGGGTFSFTLSPGTYTLTFTKTGFHSSTSSGLTVTAGNTTNGDETIYAETWTFADGDPFSDVWTIYLNTVTGDGAALKNGDELAIYAPDERGNITAYAPFESGNINSVAPVASGSATAFASPAGESSAITAITDNGGQALFATALTTANNVDIIGTTSFNGTNKTPVNIIANTSFETGDAYAGGGGETGYWVLSSSSSTTVTSNGHGLSNGTSVTITGNASYNGTYTISGVTANTFDIPIKWAGPGTANWAVNTSSTVTTDAAHGLSNGDNITITGTTDYNGTFAITNASGSTFDIASAYVSSQTGAWANHANTIVTSAGHGRTNGQSVTISGTTNYNGTWTVANATANTFEITDDYVANDATGKWVYGEQMVGLFYLTGPISNAGTANDLKAFSVLSDATTGYVAGEDFTFKLMYAGGSTLTTLNSTTWLTGTGLTDPGTTFPSGSVFSKVNLDFDLPPGSLVVDFVDESAADPDVTLNLTLKKSGSTVATYAWPGPAAYTFSNLDAGEYTLLVTGDRFQTTTYTGITIVPSTATTKNYVINHFADETQTINLAAGYQLISRRVGNDSYDMSTYLGGTMAPTPPTLTKLDMTKDEDGTSDTYSGGVVTDGGVQWDIKRGYNFKANASDAMVITSRPLAYNATIVIRASAYSMISYLPDYTLDAEVAFADLMTSDLDFIRDKDGNSLTKVAGVWVDHIGNCTAGEGFLVKWTGALTNFNYPASTKASSAVDEDMELVHFPFYDGYGNPMKNTFTMYIGGDDLEIGDEVAAFDGTTLVGATVITSTTNSLENNLNAFEELFDKSGFTNGNQIILKIWKANEDKEYWLNFENISEGENMYHGSVYPNTDGMKSVLNVALSPEGVLDHLSEYISVYPNPSNGIVNISSPENIDRLIVVNIVGQTILDFKPESANAELNLEGFNPGIYFVNIVVGGQRVTKKLTIQ
ncbi:MAG: T9SS type A sorting domain-containing protein [Chlorobi bacterium]|nr:T9SS type A sorting domain-containing protein [Chlorobiota bacterium]